MKTRESQINQSWDKSGFGIVLVLFGLLFAVWCANEILKQHVLSENLLIISQPSTACRADELEEEGISQLECELMISAVHIAKESTPPWFPSVHITLSAVGLLGALAVLAAGVFLTGAKQLPSMLIPGVLTVLVGIDIAVFCAATQLGPLLRAQYLWPNLLWLTIHLTQLIWLVVKLEIFPSSASAQNNHA